MIRGVIAHDLSIADKESLVSQVGKGPTGLTDTGHTTVWVMGDQLNRDLAHLRGREPANTRVLMVLSEQKLTERVWHSQKLHLVITAMRRFAEELSNAGFAVDLRRAENLTAGFHAHVDAFDPSQVVAMEPASRTGTNTLRSLGVTLYDNDHFLCHWSRFSQFRNGRKRTTMEDFYRWRRSETGILMDGGEPAGGKFNHDHENRKAPDKHLAAHAAATAPIVTPLDDFDFTVADWMPAEVSLFGAEPTGVWATSRGEALARLERFVTTVLPRFGDHQDAMVYGAWHLNHALLSHALNLSLLHPREVIDAAVDAYRTGHAPINAVEGFVRQVLGWREYLWGMYKSGEASYANRNALNATQPLPLVFSGQADTQMRCVSDTLASVHTHGYAHHIQRLMVLANLATLAGVNPQTFTGWMHGVFIDAYDWVMVPNVIGMGTFADGGEIATKPYVSSGAYIDRMSRDYCKPCRYDRSQRTGEDACPFTTLYWEFLDRNRDTLSKNHRLAQPYANLNRIDDLAAVRERAVAVKRGLAAGTV